MAKKTGKDCAFSIGGTLVAAGREWSLEEEDVNTETTASGDSMVDRESLRGDFTFDFSALLNVADPYVIPSNVRGTKVAFVGKIEGTDTNGIVGGTGLCTRFRIRVPYDGPVEIGGTLRAAGTALVWDLSPDS